jgi:hypothetical protein
VVRERCAAGIWAGWSDCCECRRGARANFGGARKKKWGNKRGRWGSGRFYRASTAQLMGERGREREGGHGWTSRRRAAPACSTGWRGSRSGWTARRGTARGGQRKWRGGGRKDRATCGTGSRWCRAAGAREAAGGSGHARAQRSRGDRGSGKTMEDPVAKSRKYRDLTVMYR